MSVITDDSTDLNVGDSFSVGNVGHHRSRFFVF